MPRASGALHRPLLPWLLALALALTACGDDDDGSPATQATRTAAPTEAASASPSSSPSPTPSPTPSVTAGEVLWTGTQSAQTCADGQVEGLRLRSSTTALITCYDGSLSLVDLVAGSTEWTLPPPLASETTTEQRSVTDSGIYLVRSTTTPATGLEAEKVTHELSAYDLDTGAIAWTKPLEQSPPPGVTLEPYGTDFRVFDGPGREGVGRLVVVEGQFLSAFDGYTGRPLWFAGDWPQDGAAQEYVGHGVSLYRYGTEWSAYDVQTGAVLWSKAVPDVGVEQYRPVEGVLEGIGTTGVSAVGIADGALLDNRLFPRDWTQSLVTRDVAVALVGDQLQLFRTSDLRTPLWSASSGPITPLAATDELVVVAAESGTVVLDGASGQVRRDVSFPVDPPSFEQVRDGLAVLDDEYGPSVLVLAAPDDAEAAPTAAAVPTEGSVPAPQPTPTA